MNVRRLGVGILVAGLLGAAIWPATVEARREREERESKEKKEEAKVVSSLKVPSDDVMLARLAAVTIEDALVAARGAAKGTVIAVELEDEDGGLVWSVEIAGDTQVSEVLIDAGNKAVLSVEVEDECEEERGEWKKKWRGEDDDEDEDEDEDEDDDDVDDEKSSGGKSGKKNGKKYYR